MDEVESNMWIESIHGDDISYYVTNGHCSCDLTSVTMDSEPLSEEYLNRLGEKTIEKLSKPKNKKRGWTREKIEAEAEKTVVDAQCKNMRRVEFGLCETLIRNLAALLSNIDRISIFVLSSTGEVRPPVVSKREELDISALINCPTKIEYDTLYDIVRKNM